MTCCSSALASAEFALEKSKSIESLKEQKILQNSVELGEGLQRSIFIIPDMNCIACIKKIETGLSELDVVAEARANLSLKCVTVIWKPSSGSILSVEDKLNQLGFDNHVGDINPHSSESDVETKSLLLAMVVAGFAAANIMLLSVSVWSGAEQETAHLFHLISGLIAVPTVAFSGRPFFRSAIKALTAGQLNMDVPISLAVLLALCMSIFETLSFGAEAYFDASVTLLFFLLIGRYLDQMMRQKARGAVERIVSLSAKAGVLISSDGFVQHIDLKDITVGMKLRVYAGERFPVNAKIIVGSTQIDRSHVSGESENISVGVGEIIEAGCLNLTAPIEIETISSAQTSFLAEMRKMIEVAEQGRSKYIRVADKMAKFYAPAVHLLALITFVIWMFITQGDWHISLYTAIAVLIVTCPCALGLAVPVAHVIGAKNLMQHGILMRDGTGLERLAKTNHVIFDKTGTLTTGSSALHISRDVSQEEKRVLISMARSSRHPKSIAVCEWFSDTQAVEVKDLVEHAGLGMEAIYCGKKVRFGKTQWVGELFDKYTAPSQPSAFAFGIVGNEMVEFDLGEDLRPDALKAVNELKNLGNKIEISSGDAEIKVAQIATKLNLMNYSFEQSPSDKINAVNTLRDHGSKVLMIGDGINDGPALVSGDASIVPSGGSDVGRQVADFIFTGKSLSAIPIAIRVARKTDRIVRQNFGLALAYNCFAVPLAMCGYVTPLIAAVAMSASSIAVVTNSFRINIDSEKYSKVFHPRTNTSGLINEEAYV